MTHNQACAICACGSLQSGCQFKARIMLSAALLGVELLLWVVVSTLFTEVLLWFWAYRQNSFKSLKIQFQKQGKRLESMKSQGSPAYGKKSKKADRLELQLKEQVTTALASLRLKQAVVVRSSDKLESGKSREDSRYEGLHMAKLPFEPPSLIRKLSQRGLVNPGADDCAFAFLYAVLNVGVRPNISKLLDLGPSRKMLDLGGLVPKQQ